MRLQFKQEAIDYDDINALRGLIATATGFLWLRVLSLLKSINPQLATFVLAIFQISRDILWFLVILSVLVVAFAQVGSMRVSGLAEPASTTLTCFATDVLHNSPPLRVRQQ